MTNKELLDRAIYALDISQALLEKSNHHPKILAAYTELRAYVAADRAQCQAVQEAACWIDANDLKQMQDKGRGSIVWKRPQDGYEQTALYTAPQAAAAPISRDEGLARIRGLIALDRCDGETEYAAGANAARDKYLAIIDAAKS